MRIGRPGRGLHAPDHAVGGLHGHGADAARQVLLDFEDHADGRRHFEASLVTRSADRWAASSLLQTVRPPRGPEIWITLPMFSAIVLRFFSEL